MSLPYYKLGLFGFDLSLSIAFIIGIAFGFALERGGFGNARILAAQFYLTNMRVFKVMFTAIITAMLGIFYLSWAGYLDISLIYFGNTYVLPQLLGGLILGFGFIIGGYCPGTSFVAFSTGKIDGLVFILGVVGGIFLFGETFPLISDFFYSTNIGRVTIPEYFNVSYGLIVFIVVVIALVGFYFAELAEKKFSGKVSDKDLIEPKNPKSIIRWGVVFAILGVIAVGGNINSSDKEHYTEINNIKIGEKKITTDYLAEMIVENRTNYILIDTRETEGNGKYFIPTAINLTFEEFGNIANSNKTKIILYSDSSNLPSEDWQSLLSSSSNVYLLEGGMKSWNEKILFPRLIPVNSREDFIANNYKINLSKFFGGQPLTNGVKMNTASLPKVKAPAKIVFKSSRKKKTREGC